MKITYDPKADALYISLSNLKRDRQHVIDDDTVIDLAEDGTVVGIEVLSARATHGSDVLSLNFSLIGDLPK